MREGNALFVDAQKRHANILKQREELSLCNSSIQDCYESLGIYLKLLCKVQDLGSKESIVETVAALQKCGADLGDHCLDYACVIEAVHSIGYTDYKDVLNKVVYCYLSLRALILEYLLDAYEPDYKDGCVTHAPTGIVLEATEFAYKYTLESYYDI